MLGRAGRPQYDTKVNNAVRYLGKQCSTILWLTIQFDTNVNIAVRFQAVNHVTQAVVRFKSKIRS